MANLLIHPHFGYLNSDVRLINSGETLLKVKETVDNNEYEIPAKSSIAVRLSAGEHRFVIEGCESFSETVIVEDAIKLGGSKRRKTYVFEGTPWALMVMLDRTYFLNRDTNEQYVEFGLVPDNILFLSSDYLLFITEGDNSIFSLPRQAIVHTFSNASFQYSSSQLAIFSTEDSLSLFSLNGDTKGRISTIDCDDFIIDKTNQILFYHYNDLRVIIKKELKEFCSQEERIRLPHSFYRLIGSHSAIYGINPRMLYIINLISNKQVDLYIKQAPVSVINGKDLWENGLMAFIQDCPYNNAYTSSCELSVYEQGDKWYYLQKTKCVFKNNGKLVEDSTYSLHLTDDRRVLFDASKEITITHGKSFDCVKSIGDNGFLIFPEETREFTGTPVVSPSNDILILKKDSDNNYSFSNPLNPTFSHVLGDLSEERLFKETGLVKKENDSGLMIDTVENVFQDIFANRTFLNDRYERLPIPGYFRLYGGAGDFVYAVSGEVKPMPCLRDRLLSLSEECNFALVRDEDGLMFYQYDHESINWKKTALGELKIDESFYSKAIFCSDGETILYQKTGPEFYMRKLGSEEETLFSPQGSVIRRNFNGYVPYLDFDTHRRPVYVDPVTLTRVDAEAAGQFTFQSADGTIRHITNVKKFYSKKERQHVDNESHKNDLLALDGVIDVRYGFMGGHPQPEYIKSPRISEEQIRAARKTFFYENEEWLVPQIAARTSVSRYGAPIRSIHAHGASPRDNYLELFLNEDLVCDDFVYRIDYFVRENVNGEMVDIPLPYQLYFLNYVSYSFDNRYVMIAGKLPNPLKGLCLIYDLIARKTVYCLSDTMAVWLGVFNKNGIAAFYDSVPDTYIIGDINDRRNDVQINGRSFLAFSPSGKYIALSRQGYIPYESGCSHWGHQPSKDVYLVNCSSPEKELAHFCDHGDEIEQDRSNSSVASATFSKDDKKLMTVGKDGVVVIRNLHLD